MSKEWIEGWDFGIDVAEGKVDNCEESPYPEDSSEDIDWNLGRLAAINDYFWPDC
jgi:hypothetical protein